MEHQPYRIQLGKMPRVKSLAATVSDGHGSIDLQWDAVHGANSYAIEGTEHDAAAVNWKHMGVSSKSKFTVTGLTSGKAMLFRVAAVGAAGQGHWSDPCAIYVP